MIFERRQTHFYAFVILAVILPLVFIAGIILRPTYDAVDSSANPLFEKAGFVISTATEARTPLRSAQLTSDAIQFQAETYTTPDGRLSLTLKPDRVLQQPNLLVYWVLGQTAPTELNDNAWLLGSLSGDARRQFQLPAACQGEEGQLLVYSRGTETLVAALPFAAELTQTANR